MQLFKQLFSTDGGLLIAGVIAFTIAMGVFFVRFFVKNAREGK